MEWFENETFVDIVKNNLPKLFKKAELETMRGGKIGMEVGVLRERVLNAILIKSFGYENVKTDFGTTENSKDVQVFQDTLSIKTFTNNNYDGIKVFWASDNESVRNATLNYRPQNHLLVSQIKWGTEDGGLYLIPLDVQNYFFNLRGVEGYLKINTGNNRGISIQTEILKSMITHNDTKIIGVSWNTPEIQLNIYERWIQEIN
jgi:hypothetical protein